MARPKRMGAYNALDDLRPGGVWGNPEGSPGGPGPAWDPGPVEVDDQPPAPPRRARLEPVPDLSRPRHGGRRGVNALDDLLPGPSVPPGRRPETAWSRPAADDQQIPTGKFAGRPAGRSAGRAGRHLGVWNPLDGPPPARPDPVPAPAPVPARARVSFRLPADLVETARDAVAHLAGTADRTTLTALTERALRVELARLAITHNHGQPFPPREP
jgi:hypothetical protein